MNYFRCCISMLACAIIFIGCEKSGLDESYDMSFDEVISVVEGNGTTLTQTDREKIKFGLANNLNWSTQEYSRRMTKEEIKYYRNRVTESRDLNRPIAGSEIISTQIPNDFAITIGNRPTVFGYNVVDDCVVAPGPVPRVLAVFDIGFTTNDKAIRLFTYDVNGNLAHERWIGVDNDCLEYQFRTDENNGSLGPVVVCGVLLD